MTARDVHSLAPHAHIPVIQTFLNVLVECQDDNIFAAVSNCSYTPIFDGDDDASDTPDNSSLTWHCSYAQLTHVPRSIPQDIEVL